MESKLDDKPKPPPTARKEVTETLHGVTITDPYQWLEDQESKETRSWIDAQNKYSASLLDKLTMRKQIESRLGKMLRVDSTLMPYTRRGRYFFRRKRPQDEQYILYVREGLHGKDRVLVDPNPLSDKHTTSAEFLDITKDGKVVAYALRRGGEDEIEVRLLETETGKELPDKLDRAKTEQFNFTPDGKGFYYAQLTPLVGRKAHFHKIGSPVSEDREVFGKTVSPEEFISFTISPSGQQIIYTIWHGWNRQDLYWQDVAAAGPVKPLVVGLSASIMPEFAGERILARTDSKAPNRRIVEIDPNDPGAEKWKEIVPESSDSMEAYSLAGGKIFVQYLHNVNSLIKVFDPDGKSRGEIALPGIGTAAPPFGEWQENDAFYAFTSFTAPSTVFHYDVEKAKSETWASAKVPFKAADFETKQVWVTSKDGTKVPMFLVHKKGLKLDGERPTLVTAYGGFNASEIPYFSARAVLWAEEGGVFAVANLRGGGEFGEAWHKAGMLANKQNVFDDFIAASEWLIANKVTNPKKLAIQGGSNGGLLVGAAITQRPDLYQAVICEYPLEDMVRYHKFMQGPQWVPEYGSAEDSSQFRTLYAYSPYHHVKQGTDYPSVLFVTGDADTRVAPLHARKMAALLQHATSSERPIMLHYETTAGHSGGEPLSKQIENIAREVAYLWQQLKVK
jgi:prolyl oligopeptidase